MVFQNHCYRSVWCCTIQISCFFLKNVQFSWEKVRSQLFLFPLAKLNYCAYSETSSLAQFPPFLISYYIFKIVLNSEYMFNTYMIQYVTSQYLFEIFHGDIQSHSLGFQVGSNCLSFTSWKQEERNRHKDRKGYLLCFQEVS